MKKLQLTHIISRLLLSLVLLVSPFLIGHAFAIDTSAQRRAIENYPTYDKTAETCAPGQTDTATANSPGVPGPVYLLGDSILAGAQGRGSLESTLASASFTPATVDASVSRSISGAGQAPPTSGLQAVQANATAIKSAKYIIIVLGTNKESDFSGKQTQLINAIKAINPTALRYWVDVAATTDQPAYSAINKTIYSNSAALGYKVISRYHLFFPSGDAQNMNSSLTPGLGGIEPQYGVHSQTAEGDKALANAIAGELTGARPNTSADTPSANSSNVNYAEGLTIPTLDTIIFQAGKEALLKNIPTYQQVAQEKNMPWELLAAMHYRETRFDRTNPGNGDGVYQIVSKNYPAGQVLDDAAFLQETRDAADFMKAKLGSNYAANRGPFQQQNNPASLIKDTFFSYNGRAAVYSRQAAGLGFDSATQGYEGSPYVMNRADARRDPKTAAPNTWGQIKTDGGGISYPANSDYGAYVLFTALAGQAGSLGGGGSTTGGSNCQSNNQIGSSVGNDVQRVISLAIAEYNGGANEADKSYLKYTQGRAEDWCADFVSWIYQQAGHPMGGRDGWNVSYVPNMVDIMKSNFTFLEPSRSADVQPGDLIFTIREGRPGHVAIIIEVNGNTVTTIGGNESNRIRKESQSLSDSSIYGFGRIIQGDTTP